MKTGIYFAKKPPVTRKKNKFDSNSKPNIVQELNVDTKSLILVSRIMQADELIDITIHLLEKKSKIYLVIDDSKYNDNPASNPVVGLYIARAPEANDPKTLCKTMVKNDDIILSMASSADADGNEWIVEYNESYDVNRFNKIRDSEESVEKFVKETSHYIKPKGSGSRLQKCKLCKNTIYKNNTVMICSNCYDSLFEEQKGENNE